MKNYIIVALLVIILALSSFIYKQEKTTIPRNFPIGELTFEKKSELPLILYIFFSKQNCHDCLQVIQALNHLPPQFVVYGIVPQSELDDESELRAITGAEFPILGKNNYKKYAPWYTPSIIGVSPTTEVQIFSLPGVPNEKEYILNFLNSLYEKLNPIFLNEELQKNSN